MNNSLFFLFKAYIDGHGYQYIYIEACNKLEAIGFMEMLLREKKTYGYTDYTFKGYVPKNYITNDYKKFKVTDITVNVDIRKVENTFEPWQECYKVLADHELVGYIKTDNISSRKHYQFFAYRYFDKKYGPELDPNWTYMPGKARTFSLKESEECAYAYARHHKLNYR